MQTEASTRVSTSTPTPRPPRDQELGMALVAALSGVSRSTLRAAAQAGHLQARRISPGPRGQWVLTLAAVDAWLKGARHRPGRTPQRRPVADPPLASSSALALSPTPA
jgi:hypothetical protein